MNKRRARTNAEVTNFVIGCEEACHLESEVHSIMDDEPINLDRLELRLREAIGAIKRVRDSGLGNKRLHMQLSSFEKYCKSVLGAIVGQQH
ncbi:MAG: hypothetical protein WB689_11085 [Xanthobacteraceae bacterium]